MHTQSHAHASANVGHLSCEIGESIRQGILCFMFYVKCIFLCCLSLSYSKTGSMKAMKLAKKNQFQFQNDMDRLWAHKC